VGQHLLDFAVAINIHAAETPSFTDNEMERYNSSMLWKKAHSLMLGGPPRQDQKGDVGSSQAVVASQQDQNEGPKSGASNPNSVCNLPAYKKSGVAPA